ncbi:hypothetical protein [Fodinibius sediminis]|uniref:Apea-like HEPN domain-containing protein n=1 Tax=Fodinibius sediminis TaxID=1214077 RepID=A0A521F8T2_9BACT|nr:hypothetical protein [Fodinibius sediminis]SMO92536.1 hypothetical protein SAMN06265218_12616 [Fodinibius sediminis]
MNQVHSEKMNEEKKYVLKYWISTEKFSKKGFSAYIDSAFGKILPKLDRKIYLKQEYLVLKIIGNERNIDACYDKLNLNRKWAYRVQDDLGESLRLKSYRILADLELSFREFINRAMIEVGGFNWWNTLIPDNIKERVNQVEQKTDDKQVDSQHALEFTHFDDLIKIITADFQELSDDENISVNKLSEIISSCSTFIEFRNELNERREVISIWENVFSKYFENKEEWLDLRKRIETDIIRTRHKVMHHRMLRLYEVRKLKKCSEEVQRVIKLAKRGLTKKELQEARENLHRISENFRNYFNNVISNNFLTQINRFDVQNEKLVEALNKSIKNPIIDSDFLNIINSIDLSTFNQLPPTQSDRGKDNTDYEDNEKDDSDGEDTDEKKPGNKE